MGNGLTKRGEKIIKLVNRPLKREDIQQAQEALDEIKKLLLDIQQLRKDRKAENVGTIDKQLASIWKTIDDTYGSEFLSTKVVRKGMHENTTMEMFILHDNLKLSDWGRNIVDQILNGDPLDSNLDNELRSKARTAMLKLRFLKEKINDGEEDYVCATYGADFLETKVDVRRVDYRQTTYEREEMTIREFIIHTNRVQTGNEFDNGLVLYSVLEPPIGHPCQAGNPIRPQSSDSFEEPGFTREALEQLEITPMGWNLIKQISGKGISPADPSTGKLIQTDSEALALMQDITDQHMFVAYYGKDALNHIVKGEKTGFKRLTLYDHVMAQHDQRPSISVSYSNSDVVVDRNSVHSLVVDRRRLPALQLEPVTALDVLPVLLSFLLLAILAGIGRRFWLRSKAVEKQSEDRAAPRETPKEVCIPIPDLD